MEETLNNKDIKELKEDNHKGYLNNTNNKECYEETEIINKKQKLAKKLKYIFREVRETGKYEYKKQEIPEYLKYHSDSDSSDLSEKNKFKNENKDNNVSLSKNTSEIKNITNKTNEEKYSDKKKNLNIKSEKEKININDIKAKKLSNVLEIIEKLKSKRSILKEKEAEQNFKKKSELEKDNIISAPNRKINIYNPKKEKMISFSITKDKKNKMNVDNKNSQEKNHFLTYKKPNLNNKISLMKKKLYFPKKPKNPLSINSKTNNKTPVKNNNNSYFNHHKFINNYKLYKSPNVAQYKKKPLLKLQNYLKRQKSFDNSNNSCNIRTYNKNSLNVKDLNSSYDYHFFNYNNRHLLNSYNKNKSNDLNLSSKKNTIYNNSSNNSKMMTNISNTYGNMTNLFNKNGFNNFSYENVNNNNNSLYDLIQIPINSIDLNSSYKLTNSNNILGNYFPFYNNSPNIKFLFGNNINNINAFLRLEEILILDEKYKDIISSFNKERRIYNECSDFLDYYFNITFTENIEKLFFNFNDSNKIENSMKYFLLSIIICYDCDFDIDLLSNVSSIIKDIILLNYKNLILIYEHILGKIGVENKDNKYVTKLVNIVNSAKNNEINNDFNKEENSDYIINEYSMNIIEKINLNTETIIQNIRCLLKNYEIPKVKYLTNFFKKLNDKTFLDIDNFYKQHILNVENINGSLYALTFLRQNLSINFIPMPYPYIQTPNQYEFYLILDLNETLVHFQIKQEDNSEYVIKLRPGLSDFLEDLSKYYELIVFTGSTKENANLIIDAIEGDKNKIYFKHRLYRNHMIIIDNEFVKDLNRIGRPLNKIVIVDNRPSNFRLQKENGICIKSFYGEDNNDMNLINLKNILINIAQDGGDIRYGILKYKNEIFEKVESNLYKSNM